MSNSPTSKKATQPRDEMLKARVSRAFKRRLQAAADAQGKTSSEAMRQALVEWMSRVQQAA